MFQGVADMMVVNSPHYAKKELELNMIRVLLHVINVQQLLVFLSFHKKPTTNKGKYVYLLEK